MIPADPIERITLLLSGASQQKDPDVRAVYLAAARSLFADLSERTRQLGEMLRGMEQAAARARKLVEGG